MTATGGAIVEVTWAGRIFAATQEASGKRHLGGYISERADNGNDTDRNLLTKKGWRLTGVQIEIDDDRGDQEFCQDAIDGGNDEIFSVEYTSGAVYQGKGTMTGDHEFDNATTSATVDFGGPGKLTKQ